MQLKSFIAMIDFHNHVLPDVDDGPKTIKESIEMIREAARQGITDIVQTVHFQHPKMEGKDTSYDYLKHRIDKFQNEIDKLNINIKMHLSAEVFYLPNLVEISKNPLVIFGNKKFMLIEFTTNIYPTGYENQFYDLQMNGITPVIAHPERYRFIRQDINILKKWIDKDYVIQIDAGSILGHFGGKIKDFTFKMLDSGLVHLIGSDAHNNGKRNFCINVAYEYLEKRNYGEFIPQLKSNAYSILNGNSVKEINFELESRFLNKKSIIRIFLSKLFK